MYHSILDRKYFSGLCHAIVTKTVTEIYDVNDQNYMESDSHLRPDARSNVCSIILLEGQ